MCYMYLNGLSLAHGGYPVQRVQLVHKQPVKHLDVDKGGIVLLHNGTLLDHVLHARAILKAPKLRQRR